MPKSAERNTRFEILELARELTQTRGFNWLSYQDLSDRLEIRKASVHYHFATKTDLGIEIVRDYRRLFAEWREKLSAKQLGPAEELTAYFDMFKKILGQGDSVCPGGALSLDWNTLPEEMQREVRAHLDDHRAFLTAVLKLGRKQDEISFVGDVADQVLLIGASLQGSLQLARIRGQNESFLAVVRQLKKIYLGDK